MSELRTLLTIWRKFRTIKRQLIFERCKIRFDLRSWIDRIPFQGGFIFALERDEKINLPRNEKVGNELRRPLGRWKRVKEDERHFFSFPFFLRSTLGRIAAEAHVYFRRNFNLPSSCENIRARSNYRMARDFSKGRPLYN